MQAAAPNLRKIKIILEGLPNTDDAYLKNELEINKILPLNIVQIKNGTQYVYILEYDMDKYKSGIVNIKKVKQIACCLVKFNYYVNQNSIYYEKGSKMIKIEPCSRCQVYGHQSNGCTQKIVCSKCTEGHYGNKCSINLKTKANLHMIRCANCEGKHTTFSTACPVRRDVHNNYTLHAAEPSFVPASSTGTSRRSSYSSLVSSEAGSSTRKY